MIDVPNNLSNFEFTAEQLKKLHEDFGVLISESTLKKCEQTIRVIADYKKKPAIYLWVMRFRDRFYRIYIGKTNSMSYRVDNYISEYQPHSPNDFKMRIFYGFMLERFHDAKLDLYYRVVSITELTQLENQAIKMFRPLLNHRSKPTQDAKDRLREAYVLYYRSSFERMLLDDDRSANPPIVPLA